ncbi:hypothetical protein [Rufibacter hautae]|uniref:Uncharacterized protein n=1 Tax=Rufibacter hautae TaxID=2595005 RepID=A0A5B6TAL8_9BACT|nr:hypothetical protein [Rufibacter hautae]KAA3436917.1 hypothetical protein FOA19_21315 [Rufibacter hautae]
MKKLYAALLLTFTLLGSTVAGTLPSATTTARTIAEALQLNEYHYLRIRNLEVARLKEVAAPGADVAAVNKKYAAALVIVLGANQQKAFEAFGKDHPTVQIAQVQ